MMRALWLVPVLLTAAPGAAQSTLAHSPNLLTLQEVERGGAAFVFAHRFEFFNGADEMFNIPTLTLAARLPGRVDAGLSFTSNSEAVATRLGGNETEYWLRRVFGLRPGTAVAGMAAYNSAAKSWDGALGLRQALGPLALMGELRGFSDRFGAGEAGTAAAVGAVLRLTPYLGLTGDVGRALSPDSFDAVWTAGLAVAIPGSPHSFSLIAGNAGALTLQGTSRRKLLGADGRTRYGFVFTVPLGSASQWGRIFRPAPRPALHAAADTGTPEAADDTTSVRAEIRMIAFQPAEIRIRAGQSVEWINRDPIQHTVTGRDGKWGSELLNEGQRFRQRFATPGRYPYYCLPHPQMTGVVVVRR